MKKIFIFFLLAVFIILGSFSIYANKIVYENDVIDRLNPLLKKTTGYASLPKQVTYNNGQDYDVDKAKNREFQIPDDYDTLVVDSPEDINRLTFSGGQSPEGKNYAEVVHKGAYVYKINFISWNQIPDEIKPYLQK